MWRLGLKWLLWSFRLVTRGGSPGGSDIRVPTSSRVRRTGSTALLVGVVALTAMAGLAQTGRYTVRRGETLSGIAARNGTTVQALAAANGIGNANFILIGQTLTLPGAPTPVNPNPTVVVVQPGDTLS